MTLKTIVIAWAEKTKPVPNGKLRSLDGVNMVEDFDFAWQGKACIWLNRGTPEDETKAEAFAARESGKVFVYPTTERDPLGKAKAAILEQ